MTALIAVPYYLAYIALVLAAIAIGDSPNPVLSFPHVIALDILGFPMMYLWDPIGEWLGYDLNLGDNLVLFLFFTGINAAFWGWLVTLVAVFVKTRLDRRRIAKAAP